MKRFRVVSCAICFLLAAIALMPCALAAEEVPFSILLTCPATLQSYRFSIGKCGRVSNITVGCRICKGSHFYSSLTFPHDWQETSRIEPTTEVEGTITYTCTCCGTTKTEQIPKLEPVNPDECTHDWQETGRIEPTIDEAGAVTYKCSICGKSRSEVLPKLEPEECIHDWQETSRIEPSGTTPGQIIYTCSKCGEVRIETISPVRPPYDGTFTNWLGSVLGLFSMTLNHIMGFRALQMFVGVLVFLIMFSLLAKLVRQGRRGRL